MKKKKELGTAFEKIKARFNIRISTCFVVNEMQNICFFKKIS